MLVTLLAHAVNTIISIMQLSFIIYCAYSLLLYGHIIIMPLGLVSVVARTANPEI
jgi:hypothetical protein